MATLTLRPLTEPVDPAGGDDETADCTVRFMILFRSIEATTVDVRLNGICFPGCNKDGGWVEILAADEIESSDMLHVVGGMLSMSLT